MNKRLKVILGDQSLAKSITENSFYRDFKVRSDLQRIKIIEIQAIGCLFRHQQIIPAFSPEVIVYHQWRNSSQDLKLSFDQYFPAGKLRCS
ncbi:hypothetical protein D9M69_698110 [compost metagenome]